jgi:prepilin-type processing-associated H-X9-DG protein
LLALCLSTVTLLIAGPGARFLTRAAAAEPAETIAPFVDEQVVAVGHVNLAKLDVPGLVRKVAELVSASDAFAPSPEGRGALAPAEAFRDQLDQAGAAADAVVRTLRGAGCSEMFLVVRSIDPREMPFVVAPISKDGNAEAVAALLKKPQGPFDETGTVHGAVVAGSRGILERVKSIEPAKRPDLAEAFAAAKDSELRLAIVPTEDQRRVLREMMPPLPEEFGGDEAADILADGLRWIAMSLHTSPKLSARVIVQAKDAEAARSLEQMAQSGVKQLGKVPDVLRAFPDYDAVVKLLTPRVEGDRLVFTIAAEEGGDSPLARLISSPVSNARQAAQRAQCANNLKQIGLAMHNYYDSNKRLPARSSYDADGKPLLSWRVHVLPYIEQEALYKEFHLDEPWDSEHNIKLVEKMPKVFACPSAKLEKGRTTYLVPVAEGTLFGKEEGSKFEEVRDGTSNTIMVVETDAEHAVVWTKPDDLEVDLEAPLRGLGSDHGDGFQVGFCDGSVRFISKAIDAKVLAALFTIAGGEATRAD